MLWSPVEASTLIVDASAGQNVIRAFSVRRPLQYVILQSPVVDWWSVAAPHPGLVRPIPLYARTQSVGDQIFTGWVVGGISFKRFHSNRHSLRMGNREPPSEKGLPIPN